MGLFKGHFSVVLSEADDADGVELLSVCVDVNVHLIQTAAASIAPVAHAFNWRLLS